MGRFFLDAKSHADKIDHYYKTAGALGYSKSRFHAGKLAEILKRAARTDKGRGDVFSIGILLKKSDSQMDEMRKREEEQGPAPGGGDASEAARNP